MTKKTLEQRIEDLEKKEVCLLPHYPCTLQHYPVIRVGGGTVPSHTHGQYICYQNPCYWSSGINGLGTTY